MEKDSIKIKLNIGDRLYPLTVDRSQEFYFREAAKLIEATINAFEHSETETSNVEIHFIIEGDTLVITVTDQGKGFDKSKVEIPNIENKIASEHKRGWGLKLIQELMDTVEFQSNDEGTTVTMTKKR